MNEFLKLIGEILGTPAGTITSIVFGGGGVGWFVYYCMSRFASKRYVRNLIDDNVNILELSQKEYRNDSESKMADFRNAMQDLAEAIRDQGKTFDNRFLAMDRTLTEHSNNWYQKIAQVDGKVTKVLLDVAEIRVLTKH